MAPEVITKDDNSAKPSADIFSLGRLIYTIMTGRAPLAGTSRDEIIEAALRGEQLMLEWPAETPLLGEARELVDACQGVPAESRPDITQVQASLRQWSTRPGIPDDLTAVLKKIFPHQSGSGDLQEAIQKARAEHLPSRAKTPPNGAFHAATPAATCEASPPQMQAPTPPGAPTAQLMWPLFKATPDGTKGLSLSYAICAWNILVPTDACCTKHALIKELQAATDRLKASGCKHVQASFDWQCPKCKLMGTRECDFCEDTEARPGEISRSERHRKALETWPEVEGIEDNGQSATLDMKRRTCSL